jgi:hypothetical protein
VQIGGLCILIGAGKPGAWSVAQWLAETAPAHAGLWLTIHGKSTTVWEPTGNAGVW